MPHLSPRSDLCRCTRISRQRMWRHAFTVADEAGAPVQRIATVAQSHVGGRRLRSIAEERVDQGSGRSFGSTAAVVL